MPFIKNLSIFARKVAATTLVLPQISAGTNHNLFIKTTGRLFSWGNNTPYQQLGDNTFTNRFTPISVLGATKTFCVISSGNLYSLAIDKNGRAWGWGFNSRGQLGDNTTTTRGTPVSILGTTKTFCKISGGGEHTIAIDKNGRAWSWGYNLLNQLGDTTTTNKSTPIAVAGVTKTFCKIAAGGYHSLAIDKNGRAWGWGYNALGQLGDNTTTQQSTPVSVAGAVKTFCEITTNVNQGGSDFHSLAIDKNGRAWSWGFNSTGQLGDNTILSKRTPVSVAGATKTFCKIAAGRNHSAAIDKNGRAWAWGQNASGQLGDNTILSKITPVSVAGATKTFCDISAGESHSLAIDKNGNAWSWGSITNGVLGNNSLIARCTPVSVLGTTKTFCSIGDSVSTTVVIDKNGRAWAWGSNSVGQIGDNSITSRATPVSVLGGVKTFCRISSGDSFSVAIDKNGRAWAWGLNSTGQLGDNTLVSKRTPVSVLGATKTFCHINSGGGHSVAIDRYGRVWSWGENTFGRLGDNTLISKLTPVSILGATKTFCQINPGISGHVLAIDRYGRVWGWGLNASGQLGDNTITSRLTPVSVAGGVKTFCQISGGASYSMGIDRYGRVWGWGTNGTGNLGDNSVLQKRTPVSVLGATKTFCRISAGNDHTLGIDRYGRVWSWGANSNGQLGDNTLVSKRTPISVLGATKTFCQISAGTSYSIAIEKNGRVWGWGTDSSGQLGQNIINQLTPIRVCTL